MLSDAFLARLDALRLSCASPARGGAGGVRRSRKLGSSAEFSDFREYAPGDDIRRLDWNAYARFDRLFLKLFMEEQEESVTVLLDGSGSMAPKWADGRMAAEALGYLALTGGDRVRMGVLSGEEPVISSFLTGRKAYPRLSDFLDGCVPRGQTDLMQAVRRIDPYPQGLTLLLTDGYQAGGLGKTLDLLAYRGQSGGVVQLLSREEMHPEMTGALRLRDAEGGPDVELVLDRAARRQYAETLDAFLRETQAACRKRGMPYLLLSGDRPLEQALIPALAGSGMIG